MSHNQADVKVGTTGRRLARPNAAAKYLGIARSTLYAWTRTRLDEGMPQPKRIGPKVAAFDLDEIDAFLAKVAA